MAYRASKWTSNKWFFLSTVLVVAGFLYLGVGGSWKKLTKALLFTRHSGLRDNCNYSLNLPEEEVLRKISSYRFPGVERYMKDLFVMSEGQTVPDFPVFVTAFSSNHLDEGLALLYNIDKVLKVNYPEMKVLVVDIGLSDLEKKKLELEYKCNIQSFPFEIFPEHVRFLKGYTWKPLAIQLALRQHPFVIWMDASVRFTTSNIDDLLSKGREYDVIGEAGAGSIAERTSTETFSYLNEPVCLYQDFIEIQTNFLVIRETTFIRDYFMKPWVSCALKKECMFTTANVTEILYCALKKQIYDCHRFEQSTLGILIHRLFNKNAEQHILPTGKFINICRDCTELGRVE